MAAAALAAAALAAPAPARAQASLIGGLGGAAGFGTSCLSPNDDGSSSVIDLRTAFPAGLQFFDRLHTSVFVNTNGNITFSGALPTYTPRAFPVSMQPMIAPYWADVDIRPSGCGTYLDSTGSPGNGPCLNPTDNGVWWNLSPGRMVVTWNRVGYYRCHLDLRMNFQLVLTAAPTCAGDFDVEFRFNLCQWTTGDASGGTGGFGGTPAQSGFDAGNLRDFVEIMGSRMAGINTRLCTMSNVGMPGIWRFQIRRGTVVCPGAGTPCMTGRPGICAQGLTQCVGSGTMCVPINSPRPRACNGLDNDCDGMVDSGDTLCPSGYVCDGSACVQRCVEGGCFAGQTCTTRGTCVETACVSVTCPAGQRCMGGRCVGECDGVTCPVGQVCRVGRCVDPCAGLTCGMGQVCENGVCVPSCGGCRMCATGTACQTSTGRCVSAGCETMTCPAGQVCSMGHCVDPCMGAVCPGGGTCMNGMCSEPTMTAGDAGMTGSDGGGGDTGMVVDPRADSGMEPLPDGGTNGGDAAPDARRTTGPTDAGGCACRTAGAPASAPRGRHAATVAVLFALGALGAARRRRARRAD